MAADQHEHERRKPRKHRPLSAVVHEARLRQQEKRARQVKQPWLVLKLAVGLALAVIGYACYVYIGRLCVPMLRRDQDALGSLGLGVTLLVIFILFGFMMIWSYIKVLFTPPGFAKDVVSKSSPPNFMTSIPNGNNPSTHEAADNVSNESTIGVPYETTSKPSTDTSHSTHHSNLPRSSGAHGKSSSKPRSGAAEHPSSSIPMSPRLSEKAANDPRGIARDAAHRENGHAPEARPPHERRTSGQPWRKKLTREPPLMPVLDPQYRYCKRCCLVKPPRTHHCRQCGTCVLGFDHHCPWIGQCVGARNHKYFVTFIFWTAVFCLWTFATLIGLNAKNDSKPGKHVDPQHIVVIVLSGVFSIFTVAMVATIASLITVSQTTVEHIGFRSMNESEKGTLAELHPWWDCLGKRRTRREWDREWGRIGLEGNLWWHGSIRAHWEEVMGTNVWTWLLPIGRSASDGVNYVPNPRFDAQGRWRPRREWPVDLQ